MENKEIYRFENRQDYLNALDSVMPNDYIKERKLSGSNVHHYIPQEIKESIADDIFFSWHIVDENYILIANEVVCTIKLQYQPNYPGADEYFCTGSAATPVQMIAGSKVTDFPAKKHLNALEYNIPSVRSEAIGNSFNSLGNIFGRNLNRKDVTNDFKIRKNVAVIPLHFF